MTLLMTYCIQCNYDGPEGVCRICRTNLGSKLKFHMKSKECYPKLKKLFYELRDRKKKEVNGNTKIHEQVSNEGISANKSKSGSGYVFQII